MKKHPFQQEMLQRVFYSRRQRGGLVSTCPNHSTACCRSCTRRSLDTDEIDVDRAAARGRLGLRGRRGRPRHRHGLRDAEAHERRAAVAGGGCSSSSRRAAGRCSWRSARKARSSRSRSRSPPSSAGCDAVMAVPPLTIAVDRDAPRRLLPRAGRRHRHSGDRAGRLRLRRAVDSARRLREAARALRPGEDPLQAGGRADRADPLGAPRRDRRPGRDLRRLRRHLPDRQLPPRHRRHDAGNGLARRHRRAVEGAPARRRGDRVPRLLPDLRDRRAATASRARRLPGGREVPAASSAGCSRPPAGGSRTAGNSTPRPRPRWIGCSRCSRLRSDSRAGNRPLPCATRCSPS